MTVRELYKWASHRGLLDEQIRVGVEFMDTYVDDDGWTEDYCDFKTGIPSRPLYDPQDGFIELYVDEFDDEVWGDDYIEDCDEVDEEWC